jgi:hypothetical protein
MSFQIHNHVRIETVCCHCGLAMAVLALPGDDVSRLMCELCVVAYRSQQAGLSQDYQDRLNLHAVTSPQANSADFDEAPF